MSSSSSKHRSVLTFDRGTLILHPPPSSAAWAGIAIWDDRIERLRAPAYKYRALVDGLARDGVQVDDRAAKFADLNLVSAQNLEPYAHQTDALNAWTRAGRAGVVVLPTGAGKTLVAQLAMRLTSKSTLICVPTLDLMHQWYAGLEAAFPGQKIGLLGGGSYDITEVVVATYDSAARAIEQHGNRWALLIFDECHHLPGGLYRQIAEYSLAKFRLGLTATLERSDGKHRDLEILIGPTVFQARPEDLAGDSLSAFQIKRVEVELTPLEREAYVKAKAARDAFLKDQNIFLGSLEGWQRFVRRSAVTSEGRRAMLAHREMRKLSLGTEAKIRALDTILEHHRSARVLVFTDDNQAVYDISKRLLIPAITHQTPVKERHAVLERFKSGEYPVIVTSKVLNEGVDVPEANVAVVLSGSGSTREHVQRLGRILRRKTGKFAVLFEVVAKDTVEEGISRRRKGEPHPTKETAPRETEIQTPQRQLEFAPVSAKDALEFENLEFESLGRE